MTQWQDAGNLVLGIWLFLSPWILGFAGEAAAAWNAWIVGVVIAVVAASAIYAFQKWEEWLNVALAVWLVLSPWLLGFSALAAAMWNAVVVCLLVLALAFWAAMEEH
jgi:hypothetical protein